MNRIYLDIATTDANRSDAFYVCAFARVGAIPVRFRETRA